MPSHWVPSPLETLKLYPYIINPPEIVTYHRPSVISSKHSSGKTLHLFSASLLKIIKLLLRISSLGTDQRPPAVLQRAGRNLQHGPEPRQPCLRKYETSSIPYTTPPIVLETPELFSSAYGLHLIWCDLCHRSCWFPSNWDYKVMGNCSRETKPEWLTPLDL